MDKKVNRTLILSHENPTSLAHADFLKIRISRSNLAYRAIRVIKKVWPDFEPFKLVFKPDSWLKSASKLFNINFTVIWLFSYYILVEELPYLMLYRWEKGAKHSFQTSSSDDSLWPFILQSLHWPWVCNWTNIVSGKLFRWTSGGIVSTNSGLKLWSRLVWEPETDVWMYVVCSSV